MPVFLRRFLLRLTGALPVLVGIWAVAGSNGPREKRHRQLLLPLVAFVEILITLRTMGFWGGRIQYWRDLAMGYVPLLGAIPVAFFVEIAFNVVFLMGFAATKLVYLGIVRMLLPVYETLFSRLIGTFYMLDDTYELWFLRKECRGMRAIVRNLFIATIIISVLFFGLVGWDGASLVSRNGFFPAFAVVVIGELYYALGGITKEEYEDVIQVDSEDSQRVFGYARLQDALKHYFGNRLVYGFARGGREASPDSHDDLCERLVNSSDQAERVAGNYFRALLREGLVGAGENEGTYDELSHDHMLNAVRLLRGQSVLFASPFYRDFVPYVFPAVNSQLIKNRKALFICGTDDAKQRIYDYITEGVSFVTNFGEMWRVGELDQSGAIDCDIALMSYVSLDNIPLLVGNRAFFEQVGIVVIVDPSSLLATYQLGLGILSGELSRGAKVTYCAFDRNSDGLVDSLSHALRTHLVEVGATEYATGAAFGMFWQVDGEQLQNRLLPGVTQYLGVGSELGLVALKNQVGKVSWAAHDSVPLADMRWILGQYYGEAFDFAELPQEQAQVDASFEFVDDLWSMGREPRRFVVVEDEYNNMFEAYRQYATRGVQETFVNVLVPSYLLQRYMAENSTMFAADPKAIPSLAPDFAKSVRNAIFTIVMEMLQTGRTFSEAELIARLRYVGVQVQLYGDGILDQLMGLVSEYFAELAPTGVRGTEAAGVEQYLRVTQGEEYDHNLRRMVSRRDYYLDLKQVEDNSLLRRSFSGLRNVPLITELPDGSTKILGSRLSSLVCQSWLPGQFITLDGKYYEVLSITMPLTENDLGAVLLRRAADHFVRRVYYRQLRRYELGISRYDRDLSTYRELQRVQLVVEHAEIRVNTLGYLEMERRGDLAGAHEFLFLQPDEVTGMTEDQKRAIANLIPERHYINKDVLRLTFPGASPAAVRTIATVISELLVTLFPKDHQYLAVLTPTSQQLPDGVLHELVMMDAAAVGRLEAYDVIEDNEILIVEDALIDLGLISAVYRNVRRILETCWDFLDWHADMLAGRMPTDPEFEPGEPPVIEEPRKRGIWQRIKDFFGRRFGRKKEGEGGKPESEPLDESADEPEDGPEDTPVPPDGNGPESGPLPGPEPKPLPEPEPDPDPDPLPEPELPGAEDLGPDDGLDPLPPSEDDDLWPWPLDDFDQTNRVDEGE